MKINKKESLFRCSCWGEGMLVSKFDDEEEISFSYWRQGINPIKFNWWMRIKVCWMTLVEGNYYDDEIILSKDETEKLIKHLQDLNKH